MMQGAAPSTVLCLQHSHVFTLGKRGSLDDIRMSPAEVRLPPDRHIIQLLPAQSCSSCLGMQISRSGAEVHVVKRGGEVTYHGPGQCVIYPIMDVRRTGARAFVDALESSIIATLGAWGIHSRSADGSTAGVCCLPFTATSVCRCRLGRHLTAHIQVWAGSKKIAAVGVQFSQGVSSHGAALNVAMDTAWFKKIVPCGDPDTAVTTMSEILQRPVDVAAVQYQVSRHFMREHDCDKWEFISPDELLEECKRATTLLRSK